MIRHLVRAITPLVVDSLGMILFATLLALGLNVVAATIVGAVLACSVAAWQLVRRHRVPPLQWLSLVLVLLLGSATLFTGDPRFVMIKPTIIYVAIGFAMLQRGWMIRYVDPDHVDDIRDLMIGSGYVWAGLMFVTAMANLVVALAFTAWWPLFIASVPLVSKLVLFAVQFAVIYSIGRARSLRQRAEHGQPIEALP